MAINIRHYAQRARRTAAALLLLALAAGAMWVVRLARQEQLPVAEAALQAQRQLLQSAAAHMDSAMHTAAERADAAVQRAASHNRQHAADLALEAAVADAFANTQSAELADVRIQVRQGVVNLRGTLRSLSMQQRAMAVAYAVPGVKNVENHFSLAELDG